MLLTKTACIAGASSPSGLGRRWWVEFTIGNFDKSAQPHVSDRQVSAQSKWRHRKQRPTFLRCRSLIYIIAPFVGGALEHVSVPGDNVIDVGLEDANNVQLDLVEEGSGTSLGIMQAIVESKVNRPNAGSKNALFSIERNWGHSSKAVTSRECQSDYEKASDSPLCCSPKQSPRHLQGPHVENRSIVKSGTAREG